MSTPHSPLLSPTRPARLALAALLTAGTAVLSTGVEASAAPPPNPDASTSREPSPARRGPRGTASERHVPPTGESAGNGEPGVSRSNNPVNQSRPGRRQRRRARLQRLADALGRPIDEVRAAARAAADSVRDLEPGSERRARFLEAMATELGVDTETLRSALRPTR